jgi:hypothetical protein
MTPQAVLLGVVCAAGSAVALVLTVHEARHVAPVEATVVSKARQGQVTVVVAEVRNTTGDVRCAVLRVAARDREGRDLAVGGPEQVRLAPGEVHRTTARLQVSARDARERLQRVDAFVTDC